MHFQEIRPWLSSFGIALILGTMGAWSVVLSIFIPNRKNPRKAHANLETPTISILIPAHNEEAKIVATLRSLDQERKASDIAAQFHVALDRCWDKTEFAIQSSGVRVELTRVEFGSKWKTLQHLVAASKSDWVVLVDAGSGWSPGLMARLAQRMKDEPMAAVLAPSYRIEGGGFVSRIFWVYESTLKSLENRLGGPISVHGATVAYRRDVIERVFSKLGAATDYKNDDIVLPLVSRICFPGLRTIYLRNVFAVDQASRDKMDFSTQLKRRKRMVLGNLQWIRWLRRSRQANLLVLGVAIRRILRPFWAYGLLFLAAGASPWLLVLLLVFPTAAIASLWAPVAWFMRSDEKPSAWA